MLVSDIANNAFHFKQRVQRVGGKEARLAPTSAFVSSQASFASDFPDLSQLFNLLSASPFLFLSICAAFRVNGVKRFNFFLIRPDLWNLVAYGVTWRQFTTATIYFCEITIFSKDSRRERFLNKPLARTEIFAILLFSFYGLKSFRKILRRCKSVEDDKISNEACKNALWVSPSTHCCNSWHNSSVIL